MDDQQSAIRRVVKVSLRTTVLSALRDAIITGELRPGEIYTAPVLADRFGVSATPVREAMVTLVQEDLVVALPHRGFQVTDISEAQLTEITRIRLLLEAPTVREVVPLIPEHELPRLRSLANAIVDAAERGVLVDFIAADRRYHAAILEFSGNQRLVSLVSKLRLQTRLTGLKALLDRGGLVENAREHLTIQDLIEARDAAGAEAAIRAHIGNVWGPWNELVRDHPQE